MRDEFHRSSSKRGATPASAQRSPTMTLCISAWVAVRSSLPPDIVMLRHHMGKNGLDSLRRSVENLFPHDPTLLAVRDTNHKVERNSIEIYTDVLMAYAPGQPGV